MKIIQKTSPFLMALALILISSAAQAHLIPTAIITPSTLDFPKTRVGQTAAPLIFTISKSQSFLPLNIYSISLADTANFSIVDDQCTGRTLFGGQSCQVTVDFTPGALGHYSSAISIIDSGRSIVNFVTLSGEGVAPAVTLSANALNFGDQTIGISSTLPVTLTNSGTDVLNITSISASVGDFSQTNTCPASLNPGDRCEIDAAFNPSQVGDRTGSLMISDDALGSPQTIQLQGKGVVAPSADLALSAGSLNFANQNVGTSSAAQNVTVLNIGALLLTISNITVTGNAGDFTVSGCTPLPIDLNPAPGPGNTCLLTIVFNPTAGGLRSATVNFTSNASDVPAPTLLLQGAGVVPNTAVGSLSANALNFGDQAVATTSAPQSVTLQNTGTAPLVVSSIALGGADLHSFSEQNNCIGTLPIQGTCTITATFTPQVTGGLTVTLVVTSDATNTPQIITLSGNGTGAAPVNGGGCSLGARDTGNFSAFGLGLFLPLGLLIGIRGRTGRQV